MTTPMQAFIDRWRDNSAGERASAQPFLLDLCDALGVPAPTPAEMTAGTYCFEKPVSGAGHTGATGFIDFYKADAFVLEAKQGTVAGNERIGTARRGTIGWTKAMESAFAQAVRYARSLPLRPGVPWVITVDVGHCFELWSDFSDDRRGYGGYGARRIIKLDDLALAENQQLLHAIFTDPWSLDPSRVSARVTREVAGELAALARELESAGHTAETVSAFLMRCIFTMFAEDVGLIPEAMFSRALAERWVPAPHSFPHELEALWASMDTGGTFGWDRVPRFNGALFKRRDVLRLTQPQLQRLHAAARFDWSAVDPTIFGTLIERALDSVERHKLGAHFTPRAWIERLVHPTVIEPLRARWAAVQGDAHKDVEDAQRAEALAPLLPRATAKEKRKVADTERLARTKLEAAIEKFKAFHVELCHLRVLDPACGSGNFLVVTFDLFKQLESEVIQRLRDLGENQVGAALNVKGATVTPAQFLGIEKNPRAREIAELVLWIGYLQWYRRTNGSIRPPEPVLHAYGNIECRDAVLAYDAEELLLDERGKPVNSRRLRSRSPSSGWTRPKPRATAPRRAASPRRRRAQGGRPGPRSESGSSWPCSASCRARSGRRALRRSLRGSAGRRSMR
ncbi:MAG: class I SAM-dependent DNA methyltransferase [Deltaproteobacteria bacterium]|nr:class I SAM-dependent DNA methyltransferase [Deltaproteobacteria bacterium]